MRHLMRTPQTVQTAQNPDGILIDANGTIAAVVHGFGGTPPAGQTFRAMSVAGLTAGQAAPATRITDFKEGAVVATGGTAVTVSHGLIATPGVVLVTPLSDVGTFYVSNITAQSFDIVWSISGAASFAWSARVNR